MSASLLSPPTLIDTPDRFVGLIKDLGGQPRVAVDTESNSLHAYRERVCLIQFSTPDTDYVVDPLALDVSPLGAIFSNPSIEKIFHAAEYDLICLRRDYSFTFANLFDTMQAGRILGRRQAGLDRLLEEKFGVKMNKRFQKADWAVRPLSRDLLLYARLDTHYLIPLREMLQAELEANGLWQLAQEDFELASHPNGSKAKPELPAWTRYSARRELTARDLTVLDSLLSWRDATAAELDRPPFKVLDDDRLVEIATVKPATPEGLVEAGLNSRQVHHWGSSILKAVAQGAKKPAVRRPRIPRPDAAYLKRLEKLKDWRKKTAEKMDVESDVVLPRSLLLALAESGPRDMRRILGASPWRLEHFGDQILKVLGG
ncbi:MAG TPA: HRDC domain-containing protein [Anaerolineales bacterium]